MTAIDIKFTIQRLADIRAFLTQFEYGARGAAAEASAEYVVGNQAHGLRHYVPYKYISIKQAYGGFKSAKQRGYVMAMIKEGKIDPGVPHRTGEMQRAWEYHGSGTRYTIDNPTAYVGYVMGQDQTRMHAIIGWRRVPEVIESNKAGMMRAAYAAVRQYREERGR